MHPELPPEIVIREQPEGVRYELPRRRFGAWRWFGWACFAVAGASAVGLGVAITHIVSAINQGGGFNTTIVSSFTIPLALLVPLGLYGGFATLCSRGLIELRRTRLTRRERSGVFFRTHRIEIEPIVQLRVELDNKARDFDPATRERFGEMVYSLCAVSADDGLFRIARWYTPDILTPLAHDLQQRLTERIIHHHSRSPDIDVRVLIDSEQHDGKPGDADALALPSPPDQTDITIERLDEDTSIIVPRLPLIGGSGRSLARLTMSGIGAALIGLLVYSWIFGGWGSVFSWIVVLLAVPALGSWIVFFGERIGERDTYIDIVGDTILISRQSLLGVRQHQWSRAEIKSIRCGDSSIEIDDKALPQLQIVNNAGETRGFFTGRDRDELRWLTYEIRLALGLQPAAPPLDAPDSYAADSSLEADDAAALEPGR